MTNAAKQRRAALRERLTDIAEERISQSGLSSLRARDLAREAGCALGAIYNAVGDLNELVLDVNARTFRRLGTFVQEATPDSGAPQDRLIAMAQAYHRFAAENQNAWRALFDLERPEGATAPDWYLEEMGRLFALIHGPLAELNPEQSKDELDLLTRALFSGVHGIVLLSLDAASAGLPPEQTDRMLALILRRLT